MKLNLDESNIKVIVHQIWRIVYVFHVNNNKSIQI